MIAVRNRIWLLLPLGLLFYLSMGSVVHAETILEKREKEVQQVCMKMSEEEKEGLVSVADFMEKDDAEGLMNHLNEHVLTSKQALQTETDLMTYVKCPIIQSDDRIAGKMALYEQLLTYSAHIMKDKKSLEIKKVTLERNRNETRSEQLEVTFTDNKTVTSNYFFGVHADFAYDDYEQKELEKQLQAYPKWLAFTKVELIDPIQRLVKNPLGNAADVLANYFEKDKADALEDRINQAKFTANTLGMDLSVTKGDLGKWEDPYDAQQVYPISTSYSFLERWKQIHHLNTDFPYPKKAINEEDWYAIKAFMDEHDTEMSVDVLYYIYYGTIPRGITVEGIAKSGLEKND